jgi:hypothetical protein
VLSVLPASLVLPPPHALSNTAVPSSALVRRQVSATPKRRSIVS